MIIIIYNEIDKILIWIKLKKNSCSVRSDPAFSFFKDLNVNLFFNKIYQNIDSIEGFQNSYQSF